MHQCSTEPETQAVMPEESSGEHWWPSSYWSPPGMRQDPSQLTALTRAAPDIPSIPWSGSTAALRNITCYKPQVGVSSVGMTICQRRSTLTSRCISFPTQHTRGLFAPHSGPCQGVHTVAYTHIMPVCFLLVEAAARGGQACFCTLS